MKKLIAVSMMFVASTLHAKPRAFISATVGQYLETAEILSAPIETASAGLESRHFGVSFSLAHLSQHNSPQTLNYGKTSLMPLMFNAYLRGQLSENVGVHAGGGFNYIMATHDLNEDTHAIADEYRTKIREEMKDGYGSQATGGIEFRVTPNVYMGADATYLFFETDNYTSIKYPARYNIPTTFTVKKRVDLSGVYVGLTVKYKF